MVDGFGKGGTCEVLLTGVFEVGGLIETRRIMMQSILTAQIVERMPAPVVGCQWEGRKRSEAKERAYFLDLMDMGE